MKTTNSKVIAATVDEGLRRHMISVYNNMGLGLLISGIVSYMVGTIPTLTQFFLGGPQAFVFMLAPLVMVLVMSFKMEKFTATGLAMMFYAYAALMGISLGTIFMVYKLGSIFQVFGITSITFLGMSFYGYTTKRDLTSFGGFLMMGLIGLIVASIVNVFMQSDAMSFVISVIGVLIFVGLTAYDTQKIKEMYDSTSGEDRTKWGIMGALSLYLDFINLMLHLLRLFGQRR